MCVCGVWRDKTQEEIFNIYGTIVSNSCKNEKRIITSNTTYCCIYSRKRNSLLSTRLEEEMSAHPDDSMVHYVLMTVLYG